ncbi:unnamed protein product, partial [marine sediment metagenome]
DNWPDNINELKINIKNLKNELKNLIKEKSKASKPVLKEGFSEEQIDGEFDPQIKSIETQLNEEQKKLNQAIEKIAECTTNKNDLNEKVKDLNKELKNLIKERSKTSKTGLQEGIPKAKIDTKLDPQIKSIELKLSEEQKKLDEAIEKATELTLKKDDLRVNLKNLKNELKNLDKEKSKASKTGMKGGIEKEQIDAKYDPQIKSIEAKLNEEQEKLNGASEKTAEWTTRKNDINEKIKALNIELKKLIKDKSKASKIGLKERIPKEQIDAQV